MIPHPEIDSAQIPARMDCARVVGWQRVEDFRFNDAFHFNLDSTESRPTKL